MNYTKKKTIITNKTNKTNKIKTQQKNYTNKTNKTNKNIIKILTLVKEYYKEKNDKIRVNSYEKALYQISKWEKPIIKGSDLTHLDGIGKGMVEKIDIILRSGTLPILDTIKLNKTLKTIKFTSILGFGPAFVNELITKHNARTIQDVKHLVNTNKIKLTHIQELGLNYYKDLQSLIPRDEITYLTNQLKELINNTTYTMLVSGSYPSFTKHYSKDIDILIVKHSNTKEKDTIYSGDLKLIINKIKNKSVNKSVNKSISKSVYKNKMDLEILSLGKTKFMGLIKSPISNKMRHLDIRLVTMDELPYAYLYYSSGKMFNKIIREKFKKKGYKLNEYGLYKIRENTVLEKIKLGDDINGDDDNKKNNKNREMNLLDYITKIEKELFKIASLDYKTVQERY